MSFFSDTTKDFSLFKRGTAVPGSSYSAQDPGPVIPVFRSPAVSPCSTNFGIYIFLLPIVIMIINGSTYTIFILVLPSEIFHTALEKALDLSPDCFFLLRDIYYVTGLYLNVLDLR